MKKYEQGGGVREGRNENIDDDTRARAMKFVESGGKSETAPSKPKMAMRKPASDATPARDSFRKVEAVERSKEEDYSRGVPRPSTGDVKNDPPRSRFLDDLKDNADKALAGLGVAGGTYAAVKAARNMRNMFKAKDAAETAAKAKAAVKPAAEAVKPVKKASEEVLDILKGKNEKPKVTKAKAVKKAKQQEEDDSARFADEGNPNYKKGGTVRGWGAARGGRSCKNY